MILNHNQDTNRTDETGGNLVLRNIFQFLLQQINMKSVLLNKLFFFARSNRITAQTLVKNDSFGGEQPRGKVHNDYLWFDCFSYHGRLWREKRQNAKHNIYTFISSFSLKTLPFFFFFLNSSLYFPLLLRTVSNDGHNTIVHLWTQILQIRVSSVFALHYWGWSFKTTRVTYIKKNTQAEF